MLVALLYVIAVRVYCTLEVVWVNVALQYSFAVLWRSVRWRMLYTGDRVGECCWLRCCTRLLYSDRQYTGSHCSTHLLYSGGQYAGDQYAGDQYAGDQYAGDQY